MLFDRGKKLGVIRRYLCGFRSNAKLYLDTFYCLIILNGLVLMHQYKENVVYQLILDLRYELVLLFANLNGSLNVKEVDNGDTRRSLDKML